MSNEQTKKTELTGTEKAYGVAKKIVFFGTLGATYVWVVTRTTK